VKSFLHGRLRLNLDRRFDKLSNISDHSKIDNFKYIKNNSTC